VLLVTYDPVPVLGLHFFILASSWWIPGFPVRKIFVNSSDTLPSFEGPQPIMPAVPLESGATLSRCQTAKIHPELNVTSPVRSSSPKFRPFFFLRISTPSVLGVNTIFLLITWDPILRRSFRGCRIMALRESWGPRLCSHPTLRLAQFELA